jgi:hypothetical protein
MIRTQIQMTDEQAKALKELSAREGKSIAELIRIGVDALLQSQGVLNEQQRIQRALSVVGKFRTGDADLAQEHDRYLGEAYHP